MKVKPEDERNPGRKGKALKALDITSAVANAVATAPTWQNHAGGKTAASIIGAMNDDFHRKLIESMPEDASDREWDNTMEVCNSDDCTTKQVLMGIENYDDCKEAARYLGVVLREFETALESLTWRANQIDPDRMAVDQSKMVEKQLAELLSGHGVIVGRMPDFMQGNTNTPVS